jgi:hypothetical protein
VADLPVPANEVKRHTYVLFFLRNQRCHRRHRPIARQLEDDVGRARTAVSNVVRRSFNPSMWGWSECSSAADDAMVAVASAMNANPTPDVGDGAAGAAGDGIAGSDAGELTW